MIENFTDNTMTVRTPSTEWAYVLMNAANGLGADVLKYWWESKYDHEVKEEQEPKIPSVYDCVVIIQGNIPLLNDIIDVFKIKQQTLEGLPSFTEQYSEEEIKGLAFKMLASL